LGKLAVASTWFFVFGRKINTVPSIAFAVLGAFFQLQERAIFGSGMPRAKTGVKIIYL
jgi:hypothetical protein